MPVAPLIAVDVGNARIKLGLFAGGCAAGLPDPARTLPLPGDTPELDRIEPWLAGGVGNWWIASVNRPAATRLIDWLHEHRPRDSITLLAAGDLPLEVRLERPDMVGIDRLVDAVAVNRLRDASRPAIIVDVGTAITVDLVAADGAFLGGAILPGIQMSARAMHEFTDLLPLVDASELNVPPPALGAATVPALQSGLFWGAVGAIRELIEQLQKAATGGRATPASWGGSLGASWGGSLTATPAASAARPQIFLTGGAAASVAELLGPDARYVPNLTLDGIALAAGI
jgi:type III pantothenate kinase